MSNIKKLSCGMAMASSANIHKRDEPRTLASRHKVRYGSGLRERLDKANATDMSIHADPIPTPAHCIIVFSWQCLYEATRTPRPLEARRCRVHNCDRVDTSCQEVVFPIFFQFSFTH